MFQFPAFAPSRDGLQPSTAGVPPFGHLRINSCLQIPGAFRSLPRPSSLSEAKASSVRSCSLSLNIRESHLTTSSNVSCFTRFAFEIVVLTTRKKTRICFRLIFIFTSLSLSVLSMNFIRSSNALHDNINIAAGAIVNELNLVFHLRFRRGCKGTHFF